MARDRIKINGYCETSYIQSQFSLVEKLNSPKLMQSRVYFNCSTVYFRIHCNSFVSRELSMISSPDKRFSLAESKILKTLYVGFSWLKELSQDILNHFLVHKTIFILMK